MMDVALGLLKMVEPSDVMPPLNEGRLQLRAAPSLPTRQKEYPMQPLRGLSVVDLSKIFAGPLCTQYLGDLGADIIKVEPVGGGDDTRRWAPLKDGESSTFLAFNRNKRSLAVDLKTEEGRAVVHALVKEADIVLQSFKGRTARKLGVDYESLRGLNDRLIYCEISGFGLEGPLGGQPGYDVMLQAFSGMISTMGDADGAFARVSFSPVDMSTGLLGVIGILAALQERTVTGKGSHVELCLLDTAMSLLGYLAQNYWTTGRPPERMGTAHPSLAPYQAFRASDGSLMVGAGNDAQWQRLCNTLGLREFAKDPRFATNEARVKHLTETAQLVQDAVEKKPVQHWLNQFAEAGIPCAPIQTLDAALAHPQVNARRIITKSEHPVLGAINQIGFPVLFNRQSRVEPDPPPLLGEHTAEILAQAGYDRNSIEDLVARGIVRDGQADRTDG